MSRMMGVQPSLSGSFPRVSGDEPLKNNGWGYYPWFSPRERG